MKPLEFHNTLTHGKEPFQPMTPGKVGMYVCGITPYDETHLGHARCYVVFDMLKRVLKRWGFQVRHIQNFTDVDDKIIDRARQSGKDPLGYPAPFIASYKEHMRRLNVLPADEYPLVTTHIPQIVRLIERIVKSGIAYESDGTVYYAVRKFAGYGKLSNRKLDDLEAGARVEIDDRKKDPLDFALWKKAKPDEPAWDSPWGKGRPGWHIECSAMSIEHLGEEFDIHGGGLDLIFPHHENEIAQSVGATGRGFARLWMHNGFVTINQEKMSKSLGNFFTLKDIFAKYDPMVVRYFLLSQHYRSPLNFSDQELKAAETTWNTRIAGAYKIARDWSSGSKPNGKGAAGSGVEPFHAALADDLNTAAALGVLNQICSDIFQHEKSPPADKAKYLPMLDSMFEVLGLVPTAEESWDSKLLDLVAQREQARKSRDWARSDEIRDELKAHGVVIEDTAAGPRLRRI